MAKPLTMGVLGGMGPHSTWEFYGRVLHHTSAKADQDHLRVLIDSNPLVPDRNAAHRGEGPSPLPAIRDMATGLEAQGADFLVMPCNTAHAYLQGIREAVNVPVLDMIEETVKRTAPASSAAVIATDTCVEETLYQTALRAAGIEPIMQEPVRIDEFMTWIYRVKSGETGKQIQHDIEAMVSDLVQKGGEVFIAGCTEISVFLEPDSVSVPLICSNDILAQAAVAFALENT